MSEMQTHRETKQLAQLIACFNTKDLIHSHTFGRSPYIPGRPKIRNTKLLDQDEFMAVTI
jgi:hypothetical protein